MLAPKAAPPALLGSLGLVMFVYGIGIQYGKQFFAGLTSAIVMVSFGVLMQATFSFVAASYFGRHAKIAEPGAAPTVVPTEGPHE